MFFFGFVDSGNWVLGFGGERLEEGGVGDGGVMEVIVILGV